MNLDLYVNQGGKNDFTDFDSFGFDGSQYNLFAPSVQVFEPQI